MLAFAELQAVQGEAGLLADSVGGVSCWPLLAQQGCEALIAAIEC